MTAKQKVLDIDIERYLLGELSKDRLETFEQMLSADPDLKAQVDAMKAENESILDAYPPHLTAVQITERAAAEKTTRAKARNRVLVPVFSAAAAAGTAVFVMTVFLSGPEQHLTPDSPSESEYIGIKGLSREPSLFVYRHGVNGEERLKAGQAATAGDTIQLKYAAKGQKFGMIFSVDGRGTVTLHFPNDYEDSTKLDPKGTHPLNFSYELDDAPKFERFFFVTGDKPVKVSDVLEKGKILGATPGGKLNLSADLKVSDFILKKK
jgi:hypothetical protein